MEELAAKYQKMENEEDETTAVASRYAQYHITSLSWILRTTR